MVKTEKRQIAPLKQLNRGDVMKMIVTLAFVLIVIVTFFHIKNGWTPADKIRKVSISGMLGVCMKRPELKNQKVILKPSLISLVRRGKIGQRAPLISPWPFLFLTTPVTLQSLDFLWFFSKIMSVTILSWMLFFISRECS